MGPRERAVPRSVARAMPRSVRRFVGARRAGPFSHDIAAGRRAMQVALLITGSPTFSPCRPMMMRGGALMTGRPADTEFALFYKGYISLVPESEILPVLEDQTSMLGRLARAIPPDRELFRYAPGKWSVREIFGHLADAERVFGYRAFCISRGEQQMLPGFDENDYVAASAYDRFPVVDLAREFVGVRRANLLALGRLERAAWAREGNANGSAVSVRALAFIMAGHVRHHAAILASRYGLRPVA
jgi:hypothetical protein